MEPNIVRFPPSTDANPIGMNKSFFDILPPDENAVATAIGINMATVAVLLINAEIIATDNIMIPMNIFGELPNLLYINFPMSPARPTSKNAYPIIITPTCSNIIFPENGENASVISIIPHITIARVPRTAVAAVGIILVA